MKTKSLFLASLTLGLLMVLFTSFNYVNRSEQKEVKHFLLSKGDNPMSEGVKTMLAKAYKAQYGTSIINDSILYIVRGEDTYLVFNGSRKTGPTVAYKTFKKKKPAETTLPNDAPKETCTGNPCSVCRFGLSGGCYCDGGNGSCNHSVSRITEDEAFMAALFK